MKKIINILALVGLLWSCDPMEDTYKNLDNAEVPYHENIEYTLISADYSSASKAALKLSQNASDSSYANMIKSQNAFNTRFTANELVGNILATNFNALNKNSAAKVTYRTNLEDQSSLNSISDAHQYSVKDADYTAVGGSVANVGYFIPSSTADENIPAILAAALPSAVANDYAIVSYKQSDFEPSTGSGDGGSTGFTGYIEDFNSAPAANITVNEAFDGWVSNLVSGDKTWISKKYGDNFYIQASSFGTADSPNEMWAISPEINLAGAVAPVLSFEVCFGYVIDGHSPLSVWITKNYSGDAKTTTWTELTSDFDLTVGLPSGGSYGVLTNCGSASIASFAGEKVRIGFKYSGSDIQTTTVQVDNVTISNTSKSTRGDLFKTYNDVYQFNGTAWKKSADVRAIHQFEYIAMGQSYGNFSASAPAENYLPTFLANTYPYAVEGDSKIVAYKYYASSTTTYRATKFDYLAGTWTPYNGIVEKTDQFVHTGEAWIFDPTIKFTMTADDMWLIVHFVQDNLSSSYSSSYGNDEFYYGASAHYVNFDLRLSNKVTYKIPGFEGLSEAEQIALTWSRLEEALNIMLGLKYPEATSTLSGSIPIYYWVTFATYENDLAKNTYTGIFQFSDNNTFERMRDIEDAEVAAGNLTDAQVKWNR